MIYIVVLSIRFEQGVCLLKAPKFIDNKTYKMIDEVKEYTKKNSKISMISASFTLFTFESLKDVYHYEVSGKTCI